MIDRIIELALRIKVLSEKLEDLEKAKDNTNEFKEAVAGLRNQIVALGTALFGLDKLRDFVTTGVEVNKELENTRLGIAGIVSSQAELADSQGQVLAGQSAFNAAAEISVDQLQKLKIDSLQTTATFGQLKDAFQAAISPGLAAGLNLDQIRNLTKEIALTAGALGLDTSQIAQETQSILSGEIDINSTIARNLGITNETVEQWKEQGTLAEELSKRMRGFVQMGEETGKSWAGVTSNLTEAYQTLAGLATAGFYDQIKTKLNEALSGVFNLQTGQLESDLQGVSDLLTEILTDLGTVLGDSIIGIMDGLKSMSGFLEANKGEVEGIRANFGLVFDQVQAIGGELLTIVKSIVSAGAEGQVLSKTFGAIAQTIAAFRDGVDFLVMAFTKLGAIVLGALATPIEQAGKALSLFGLETGAMLESLATIMREQANAANESAGKLWDGFGQGKTHLNALNQEAEKFRTLINIPESKAFGGLRDQIEQFAAGLKDAKKPVEEIRAESERLKSQIEIMFSTGQISRDEYVVSLAKIDKGLQSVDKVMVQQKGNLEKHYQEMGKLVGLSEKFAQAQRELAEASIGETEAAIDLAKAKGDEKVARELNAKLQQQEAEAAKTAQTLLQAELEGLRLKRQQIIDAVGGIEKLTAAQRLQIAQIDQLIAAKQKDIAASGIQIERQQLEADQAARMAGPLGQLIRLYEQKTAAAGRETDVIERGYDAKIRDLEVEQQQAEAKGDTAKAAEIAIKIKEEEAAKAQALADAKRVELQAEIDLIEAQKLAIPIDEQITDKGKEKIAAMEAQIAKLRDLIDAEQDKADSARALADAEKQSSDVLGNAAQNAYKFSNAQADVDKRNNEVGQSTERVVASTERLSIAMAKFRGEAALAFAGPGMSRYNDLINDIKSTIERATVAAQDLANRGLSAGVDQAEQLIQELEASDSALNDMAHGAAQQLRQALADARREAEEMTQSLTEAADSFEREILRIQGNKKALLERDYQDERRKLEASHQSSDAANEAEYQKAKARLEELHRLQMQQLEEEEKKAKRDSSSGPAPSSPSGGSSGGGGGSGMTIIDNSTKIFQIDPTKLTNEEWIRRNVIPTIDNVARLRK